MLPWPYPRESPHILFFKQTIFQTAMFSFKKRGLESVIVKMHVVGR